MTVRSKSGLGERTKNICDKTEIFGKDSKKSKLHTSKKRRAYYYIPGIFFIVQLNIFLSVSCLIVQLCLSSFVTSQTLIDLFRPHLLYSYKVFKVAFVHFVYNSALFLSPCYFSFFLNFVPNFICTFLVSLQLVLHSALPKFLNYFCGSK
jgi:hypothetical protein